MSFLDDVEATCQWLSDNKLARIWRGKKGEPAFSGRLLDDPLGAGTRIVFDAVQVPAITEGFSYDLNSRTIPLVLDRVQFHEGVAFVLIKRGPVARLTVAVRRLVFGDTCNLSNCPVVDSVPTVRSDRAVVIYNFLPVALECCGSQSVVRDSIRP